MRVYKEPKTKRWFVDYFFRGHVRGWVFDNDLFYLLPATYSNGWLAGFEPETIASFARGMAVVNFPMKVGALVLEAGCLFILAAKRKGLIFFLTGFITFHMGVFSFTGIAMWQFAESGGDEK